MGNADRIAIRITADEYRLGDAEALEHITALVRRGDEDVLDQIIGILAESGRDPSAEAEDDLPAGYDPETGEFDDVDEDGLGVGMHELEEDLINACLDGIFKPRSPSA